LARAARRPASVQYGTTVVNALDEVLVIDLIRSSGGG
jgi:hypothetical protein